jgi:hypothetical protein
LSDFFNGLKVVLPITFGFAILVSWDEVIRDHEERSEGLTFAGLAYRLMAKRKPLLAAWAFGVLGISILTYLLFASLFKVEYSDESGITIRLPGQTIFYYPIHPFGWQNTGYRMKPGQSYRISLSGQVSPGYLQNISILERRLATNLDCQQGKIKGPQCNKKDRGTVDKGQQTWPFSGPAGYTDADYKKVEKIYELPNRINYKTDRGLTVMGLPHNTVIGFIQEDGGSLCIASGPDSEEPCTSHEKEKGFPPAYEAKEIKDFSKTQKDPVGQEKTLLNLSSAAKNYQKKISPDKEGVLWVTINDADEARWDNSGLFFLKIETRYP